MAREEFITNLWVAARSLPAPQVRGDRGPGFDSALAAIFESADLWLTKQSVEGFDPTDFADLPEHVRETLSREVAAFLAVAEHVPPKKPAMKARSDQARKHLEGAIEVVGSCLLKGWLSALEAMMDEAETAARGCGWHAERDDKAMIEGLLGPYRAPRLRVRSLDVGVVLDPVAYFGSGSRGVVDLLLMPTYEMVHLIVLKGGRWRMLAPHDGSSRARPFNAATFKNTVSSLAKARDRIVPAR